MGLRASLATLLIASLSPAYAVEPCKARKGERQYTHVQTVEERSKAEGKLTVPSADEYGSVYTRDFDRLIPYKGKQVLVLRTTEDGVHDTYVFGTVTRLRESCGGRVITSFKPLPERSQAEFERIVRKSFLAGQMHFIDYDLRGGR